MPSPESAPKLSLAVGTRLYAKTDGNIMPQKAPPRVLHFGGIPIGKGFTVEILEIEDNTARIQLYSDDGRTTGEINRWYALDQFSPDIFSIDHRNPSNKTGEFMSRERASELLEKKGEIRSTDGPGDVAETFRAAYKKLSGTDEIQN